MSTARKQAKSRSAIRLEPGLARKIDKPAEGKEPVAIEHRHADRGLPEKTDAPRKANADRGEAKPDFDERAAKRAEAEARNPSERKDDDLQIPARPAGHIDAGSAPEQYVRIRIHCVGERLEVIDSHLVDGPLGPPRPFTGTNAYEVSLGDRMVHAGSLPDLGVQRSFVDPDGPAKGLGHFETERTVYDFNVRVPARELTKETIGKFRVTLHRIKEPARIGTFDTRRLDAQMPRAVRPVAELVGLPASVLPAEIEARGGRTPNV